MPKEMDMLDFLMGKLDDGDHVVILAAGESGISCGATVRTDIAGMVTTFHNSFSTADTEAMDEG